MPPRSLSSPGRVARLTCRQSQEGRLKLAVGGSPWRHHRGRAGQSAGREAGLAPVRRRSFAWAWTIGAVLALAGAAGAQDAPRCDPIATPCLTTERYVLVLRAWTQGRDPRDLAGGRWQAELRYRHWRLGARLDGTAASGEYRSGDLATVRTVEGHVVVAYDALGLPQGITVGPAIAAGGAVALESQDGIRASLPRAVTAVVGARISWPGGWLIGGAGAVQEFGRGVGAKATWQIRTSDRTVHIGTVSYGRRLVPAVLGPEGDVLAGAHSEGAWFAWIGEAVRF